MIGTGGIGKTRLAIQVAEEMKSDFAGGVWFIELAGVADPALVLLMVATALGIQEEQERSLVKVLADFLHEKRLLLILDNCEHLLDACATLAHALLSASPALRILATSRERLNIRFEIPFRVPSLSIPDLETLPDVQYRAARVGDYASVRLFVERARLLCPDLTVTDQNASLLASICHRLDGIPLAIELAAGRMEALSLEGLERGVDDCFRLLIRGYRAALPRQQTLQATMDWSYNLLSEQQKALLRRLSVFAGGCRLEAAQEVCVDDRIAAPDVLNLLASLVAKSLVVCKKQEEMARYTLLETVRQYGRDRLAETGENDTVLGRHRDYFQALAEEIEPKLKRSERAQGLAWLEAEHDNLRAALEYSLAEAVPSGGLRLCRVLLKYGGARGHFLEGVSWCRRALAQDDAQKRSPDRAEVLNGAGILATHLGDYSFALTCHQESLTIYQTMEDQDGIAISLNYLGSVAEAQGDYASARSQYEASLTIRRECGDQPRIANLLKNLGSIAYYQGDYPTARHFLEESLILYNHVGIPLGRAVSLEFLGDVTHAEGDEQMARSRYAESLAIFRELGVHIEVAYVLYRQGHVAGDDRVARRCYEESLSIFRKSQHMRGIVLLIAAFAALIARENTTDRPVVLWGATEAICGKRRLPQSPGEQDAYDRAVAQAREVLGPERFSAAWERGRSMSLDQAIAYALQAPAG